MISLLWAMDRRGHIGHQGQLPWSLPADLQRFKRLTMGHTLLMGRKTYESIGRPLPGRRNLVLTSRSDFAERHPGVEVVDDLQQVLDEFSQPGEPELFVIGGGVVFEQVLPQADRLYVTMIDHEFDGDTRFPPLDWSRWQLVEREAGVVDEKNRYQHEFRVYDRLAYC